MGQAPTVQYLQTLIFQHCPSVVFHMETKQPRDTMEVLRRRLKYSHSVYVDPEGRSGGLALWWLRDVNIVVLRATKHFIDVQWTEDTRFFITFVYGAPRREFRLAVWQDIIANHEASSGLPWCLLGDFNAICSFEEKDDINPPDSVTMRDFNNFIQSLCLMEVMSEGARYTWTNNNTVGGLVRQRLDRVLCNVSWHDLFPKAHAYNHPITQSDHSPVILHFDQVCLRQTRGFKFEESWMLEPSYTRQIETSWVRGSTTSENLQTCAVFLSTWKKEVISNNGQQITNLLQELAHVSSQPSSSFLVFRMNDINAEVARRWNIQESYWAQRAKKQWLVLGDHNTKFFHKSTVQRRKINTITTLKAENGSWIDSSSGLSNYVMSFYKSLFSATQDVTDFSFLQNRPKKVDQYMNAALIHPVTDAEIKATAFQTSHSKAPGPDGYPGRFFQEHWQIVAASFCSKVHSFFNHSQVPDSWNDTFIALLPKVKHPEEITQFRPIGLANFRMKVISKILTSRLKPYISSIVSELQSAFTGNRSIQDNVVIVHEVVHNLRTRKKGKMYDFLFKVDMLKAFDRVSWDFLFATLHVVGFSSIWIGWIRALITTVRFNVLLNGAPTRWFNRTRGLRQGDPLSPFLFIIVSNVLSFMLQQACNLGRVKGVKLNSHCPVLHHVLFADDTILFGTATVSEAKNIMLVLHRYCQVSGQAINIAKSSVLFSSNTPKATKLSIAFELGVNLDAPIGNYLGVPADWGATKSITFRYMLERLIARAQTWQSSLLSHAGRSVMIKAILQALPSYIFSCFLLPKHLLRKMDQVLINFWWSGDGTSRKIHWLAASELRKPVSEGGLGFGSFYDFNLAFVAKMAWKILTQPETLWVQLLKGLYFPRSEFLQVARHHRASWIWASVMEGRKALLQGLRKNIGDGHGTHLVEAWIPEAPHFYAPLQGAEMSSRVSDYILNPQRIWDVRKLRLIFAETVVKQICLISLGPEGYSDQLIWHYESSGNFSVRSCYKLLRRNRISTGNHVDSGINKLWKWLWQLDLPPKVRFFVWRACRHALPTRIALTKRRCGTSATCMTCQQADESLEHLLFHCSTSKAFWQQVLPSIRSPIPGQSTLQWFTDIASSASKDLATEIGFTVWFIWKMRNEVLFQNILPSLNSLMTRRTLELQRWRTRTTTKLDLASTLPITLSTNSLAPTAFDRKVVCDGAYLASIRKGAYGAILYDAEGRVVNRQAGSSFCAAPINAEALAILATIDLAKSAPIPTTIYTDCSMLTQAITEPQDKWPWIVAGTLASICRLLFWNQQITVCYASRSTVQAAHRIAHLARDELLPRDWLSRL